MNRQLRLTNLHCLLAAVCFALVATAFAVDPPPDGGYPNETTAEGEDALFSETTGVENTALGYHALYSQDGRHNNTGVGANVLAANVAGYANTAVGADALSVSTYTNNNTAIGYAALSGDFYVGDSDNVAVGYRAMALASSYSSVAIGSEALVLDQGQLNVAVGKESLTANVNGAQNTAVGWRSLFNNKSGSGNTAEGLQAMFFNRHGNSNVAVGQFALGNNMKGSHNIALGFDAGMNTKRNNNIMIGNDGAEEDARVIRIGTEGTQTNSYIAGISGVTVAGGVGVVVDASGHLGTLTSSARYKDNIKPMDKASEAIFSLKPVTFRYKKALDPKAIPQFGLVAEQVEKVSPDLVACDEQGKPYTVRYEAVNAMLLNEFLKEHRKVESLEATVMQLHSALREQAAQIEKISARLETNGPVPRVVVTH